MINFDELKEKDIEIYEAIMKEKKRQQDNLEMIASENFTSEAVMEAMGSYMTNKYAEGYPGKRYYAGCQNVDVSEDLEKEATEFIKDQRNDSKGMESDNKE